MATSSAGIQSDKASEEYWSGVWEIHRAPEYRPLESRSRTERLYLHPFFQRHLKALRGASLIEVGCGNSMWLPYFAHEFGLRISGLDYSPLGCETSRSILSSAGVKGEIHLADVFAPPDELEGAYDVVASMGVIEHFEDTAEIVRAAARLVKPGGLVLTTLPNLSGWLGSAQKLLDRKVYDVHVPLTADQVRQGHKKAGLNVIECEYSCPMDFHINDPSGKVRTTAHKVLMRVTRTMWAMERFTGQLTPNQKNATYILCAARVPD